MNLFWESYGIAKTMLMKDKVGGVKSPHLKTKYVTTLMNTAIFSLKMENWSKQENKEPQNKSINLCTIVFWSKSRDKLMH